MEAGNQYSRSSLPGTTGPVVALERARFHPCLPTPSAALRPLVQQEEDPWPLAE